MTMNKALTAVLSLIASARSDASRKLRQTHAPVSDLHRVRQRHGPSPLLREMELALLDGRAQQLARTFPELSAASRATSPMLRPRARTWPALIGTLRELLRGARTELGTLERDWASGADHLPCGLQDAAGEALGAQRQWVRLLGAALDQAQQAMRRGEDLPAFRRIELYRVGTVVTKGRIVARLTDLEIVAGDLARYEGVRLYPDGREGHPTEFWGLGVQPLPAPQAYRAAP